ncbi:hypothetical protein B5F52_17525 [Flavonifractor plautii]|nr:hypothetical protein B5F52_17525 [Flavonifractor plautii]
MPIGPARPTLTRRGGTCPRPPLSSPSQASAGRPLGPPLRRSAEAGGAAAQRTPQTKKQLRRRRKVFFAEG